MNNKIIKEYGIIGNPLVHSYSPQFFNEKFKEKKMDDSSYLRLELPSIEDFVPMLKQHPLLRGLNVTIPYKQQIMPFLDEIDEKALEIGAVNVVKITKDGNKQYLKGYNSDWFGFEKSLKPMLKPWHTAALVLGTGGASKAVIYTLKHLGIEYMYVSRVKKDGLITYEEINEEILDKYKIIINTTPLGTFPNVKCCPEIPYHLLTKQHIAYDLTYNPIRTLFLQQSQTKGCETKNGWEMFVYQALRSYEIWEGIHWEHKF